MFGASVDITGRHQPAPREGRPPEPRSDITTIIDAPCCPRCRYDLGGVSGAAQWHDACPIEGRCPECGLVFRWCNVIVSSRTIPEWSAEHASTHVPTRFIATLARTLMPWILFRDLRVEHEIRIKRLIILTLVAACVVYAGLGAMAGSGQWISIVYRQCSPRALPWANSDLNLWTPLHTSADRAVMLHAVRFPYVFERDARMASPGMSPIEAATTIAAWCVLTPLSFLVLGQTLRAAKVSSRHLFRLGIYAAWMNILLYAASAVLVCAGWWSFWIFAWIPSLKAIAPITLAATNWTIHILVMMVLNAIWWQRAVGTYLRLPRPTLVSTLMALTGILGGFAAQWIVSNLLIEW